MIPHTKSNEGAVHAPCAAMQLASQQKLLLKSIEDTIVTLGKGLIQEGCDTGDWDDTRGTGDALLALSEVLRPGQYPCLVQNAYRTIVAQAIRGGDDNSCWGEEVWDTSIALIALSREVPPRVGIIKEGANWLLSIYNRGEPSWYSEPWETMWALIALREAMDVVPSLAKRVDPTPSLKWLLNLFDSSSGMLINHHYTAQFLIASTKWIDSHSVLESADGVIERLQEARFKAADMFLTRSVQQAGTRMWTSEVWANALIMWGLADAGALGIKSQRTASLIEDFRRESELRQLPTEDRAFALVALSKVYQAISDHAWEQLPHGLLDVEKRILDPNVRAVLEHLAHINRERMSRDCRSSFGLRLEDLPDYNQKPPLFDCSAYSDYYQLNLRKKHSHIALIVLASVCLTTISVISTQYANSKVAAWAAAIPIVVGVLATLAQLFDIHFMQWLKQPRKR